LLCVSIFSDASIQFQITTNTQVDTSLCPVTYYGQEYTTVYMNFTGEHMFVCFNGYYNPESNGDCIKAPNAESKNIFELNADDDPFFWTDVTTVVQSSVNTITNDATCYMTFSSSVTSENNTEPSSGCRPQLWFTMTLFFLISSISCLVKGLCTVTGPTVIDFRGQMSSVSDRCEYTLLQDQSAGFTLKANFLERRRRDVSFVDSVTLDFSQDDDIQLLQGHRVLVSSPVILSGSVQTFNGVGLSKDQTGVTANISLNGSPVSLFFDGTTAQIYMDVPVNVKGLCADSSSSSSSRLSTSLIAFDSLFTCSGGPTVCMDNTASLTLVGCLLKENGIDYTHLHLNDKTCTGVMDPESHMLKINFSSDSCGTEVTTNNSQVIFTNAVVTRNSSSDLITRQDKVFIEFSCSHPAPELQNVAFKIIDNWIMIVLQSGEWHYNLTMKAYSDAAQTQLLGPNSDVRLNQKIWIVLETNGLDEEVVSVVTDSCWATSGNSSSSSPRYDLITDGCFFLVCYQLCKAADGTVQVMGNGQGTSNSFSFNMFEFSGKEPSEVYLHCQLQLCVRENNSCEPGCFGSARRRRSLRYRCGAPALISMVWTP
uniref:ZP domain-containing protein n=1 Tax=Oryzias latipes TaxID=8090 RepID=A0A3P9I7X7_ORYLA